MRTAGGGSTGSVRNLRIREDTAKYLLNLDTNSGRWGPVGLGCGYFRARGARVGWLAALNSSLFLKAWIVLVDCL